MPVQGVVFDAFGTLLKIQNGQHPYRQLIKLGQLRGRRPRLDDVEVLMTHPLALSELKRRKRSWRYLKGCWRRRLLVFRPIRTGCGLWSYFRITGFVLAFARIWRSLMVLRFGAATQHWMIMF